MAKRKRRRTGHPGVKELARRYPTGTAYVARWTDPLSGAPQQQSLTVLGLTSAEARRAWLIAKSKELAREKQAMSTGRLAGEPQTIEQAIKGYLERCAVRLRPRTVDEYAWCLDYFARWADEHGVRDLRRVTAPQLRRYRDWLAALPRERGGGEHRRAATVNHALRPCKTFLLEALDHGLLALTSDEIKRALKPLREDRPRPEFLRPDDCAKLLAACRRHDEATFELTRAEKAGEAAPGSTPRYTPAGPLVAAALLSGCRIGELQSLMWKSVRDGELIVTATASKTRTERAVDLAVSPALAALLDRMRLAADPAQPYVFGGDRPLPRHQAENTRRRLVRDFGAPAFSWQQLRQTCATVLTNAPAIFGAASAYRSARQLGHGVVIAERNYVGLLRDIDPSATTIETALGVEHELDALTRELRAVG